MTARSGRSSAVTVEFSGARGGESPLTWGQLAIWRITRWLEDGDPYFNMPWVLPVYGRHTLEAVIGALRGLVERYETLRTTCEEIADGPVQRVVSRGRFDVEVVDAGEDRPLAAAKKVSAELAARGFDYAVELPFRCAVVTVGGRPRAVAFALSHLAVDGWALDVLAGDWRALLAGDELSAPEWQPLDQAAFEREGTGAARGERALRHCRAELSRAPETMFDFPRVTAEEPRFVRVGMESGGGGGGRPGGGAGGGGGAGARRGPRGGRVGGGVG
ncbi:condensation domain-containing protein [Streptosporangium sp. NPDC049644]|uniref:condensation domain-containing protein n=1 Tax=Streptosporangium sp. NPDC049644 TaxID=3155507 RepID=UPI00343E15E5